MSPGFYLLYSGITLLIVVGALMRKRCNRGMLPTTHADREGYKKILYLRSFLFDGKGIQAGGLDVFQHLNLWPVELELANILLRLKAHLVTIGKPLEEIPEIGFDRRYFDDDQWKPAVLDYMEQSVLIIYRPDSSDSLLWELEQILEKGYAGKTLIWADMGYGTDYTLNKVRYNIFARKAGEKCGLKLPEYNRWKTWIALDENDAWHGYTLISSAPAYKATVQQLATGS